MNVSIARLAPFATDFDKIGSNLAASNSFTIARALASPSFAVGTVVRDPRLPLDVNEAARTEAEDEDEDENADETDSVNRFVERFK